MSLDGGTITVTDAENVELLVKAANLLNYKFGAPDTTDRKLTVTYTLENRKVCVLSASHERQNHPLKESDVLYNVLEGLFFNSHHNDAKG